MSVLWSSFDFTEHEDKNGFLYSEVIKKAEVVVPGGKTIKVKEGDILVVDKAGTKVEVLEDKNVVLNVFKNVGGSIEKEKERYALLKKANAVSSKKV